MLIGLIKKGNDYRVEKQNIVFDEADEGVNGIIPSGELKGKRLYIKIKDENKEIVYEGNTDNFNKSVVPDLGYLELSEYNDSSIYSFVDYDSGIECEVMNIDYIVYSILTDNVSNIHPMDYKFLKDFSIIYDYLNFEEFSNYGFDISDYMKDENPSYDESTIEGQYNIVSRILKDYIDEDLNDEYSKRTIMNPKRILKYMREVADINVINVADYMDQTLTGSDGGLVETKEQIKQLDTLLADYLKNNQTSKTRKLNL